MNCPVVTGNTQQVGIMAEVYTEIGDRIFKNLCAKNNDSDFTSSVYSDQPWASTQSNQSSLSA